ncbi:MAG TPA: hypothetical protein VGK32_15880 [Vicinamibacterales bacterium]|jgi:hypothetical protein
MLRRTSFLLPCLLVVVAFLGTGCRSRAVDLAKALEVTDVTTGFFDAGIVEGTKNKLVPSISFRLKNRDNGTIVSVQAIAKFSRVGEPEEWGSAPYVRAIGPEGLPAGQSTSPIVVRCDRGYTGEQPRAQMLQNRQFVDVRVELFAKYMANSWVKMGDYRITRQLLTR